MMRIKLSAAAVAVMVVFGACSTGGDDSDATAAGVAPEAGSFDGGEAEETAGDVAGGGGSSAGTTGDGSPLPDAVPSSAAQSQVIRSAELRIELEKGGFREAFERATFLAGSHQGFVVDSSSERGREGLASGAVVLRVPAKNFDAARKDLTSLGKVMSEQVKGEEVSGQLVDLAARLRNLRAQEESLRTLMERSATVPETMQVQQNLFSVREQIEQLGAQEARLSDGVAFSTIRVSIAERGAALLSEPEPEPEGLAGAFQKAVDGALDVIGAFVIAVGYLTPLALLLAALMLVWRIVHRPSRRVAAEA